MQINKRYIILKFKISGTTLMCERFHVMLQLPLANYNLGTLGNTFVEHFQIIYMTTLLALFTTISGRMCQEALQVLRSCWMQIFFWMYTYQTRSYLHFYKTIYYPTFLLQMCHVHLRLFACPNANPSQVIRLCCSLQCLLKRNKKIK